jgi:hypothetical protein
MSNLKLFGIRLVNDQRKKKMNEINLTKNESKQTVKTLVENYIKFFKQQNRSFDDLRPLLSENFKFSGPIGSFANRDAFLMDLKRDPLRISDIKIHHILVDGDHASALYEVQSSDPQIQKVLISEWYTTEKNKISSLFSIYDATEIKNMLSRI